MSFSSQIKQEMATSELEACCMRSQLSALIQLTSSLSIVNKQFRLIVRCENPTVARRVVFLLKKLYRCDVELSAVKKNNLLKNNVYTVEVVADGKFILADLGLYSEARGLLSHPTYSIVAKNCCARNYVAGCFLAYGSCNSPANKNYHLELALSDREHSEYVIKLLSRFNIEAKHVTRRNKEVVYLKKMDAISDFLRVIGANSALIDFEDSRISRDLKHSIVRMDNCEIANEMKSLKASGEQVAFINKIIENGRDKDLDEKLKNIIELRLQYQDYTLSELCEVYNTKYGEPLSKSGLKHRLNKLEALAKQLN